ncbi:MAG: helix-turn-helix domain-containing protein [Candidatus Binataceae bacterium]
MNQKNSTSAFDSIVLVIGEQLAEKLVRDLGGLSFWIPAPRAFDQLDFAGPALATIEAEPEASCSHSAEREAGDPAPIGIELKPSGHGSTWSRPMAERIGIIERSVGSEAARKLVKAFACDRLVVPFRIDAKRRRRRIVAMHREGKRVAEIARELRCTERLVWRVLAEPIDGPAQRRRPRRKA